MSGFLTAVIAVGAILGFMILIHEFGHYAAAKFLGVRVEVFSIGFGKRLLGFRRGDTDYRIAAIPLGGYVKMSGENPMDERNGYPAEFMSHTRWHRFIIDIAGPAMNIVLAIGLLTGVYMVHYEYPAVADQPAVIGWVMEDTPAAKAGIQPGDRIVRIDGIQNPTWKQVIPKEALSPNQSIDVTIERGSQSFEKTIVPEPYGWDQKRSDEGTHSPLSRRVPPLTGAEQRGFAPDPGAGAKNGRTQDLDPFHRGSNRDRRGGRKSRQQERLDAAAGIDVSNQLEPGGFQPIADPHPGRWRDPAAVCGRPHAPRHQPAYQGEDLSGGICIPGAVCRYGDLQRSG